jgi:hypothetical protein
VALRGQGIRAGAGGIFLSDWSDKSDSSDRSDLLDGSDQSGEAAFLPFFRPWHPRWRRLLWRARGRAESGVIFRRGIRRGP